MIESRIIVVRNEGGLVCSESNSFLEFKNGTPILSAYTISPYISIIFIQNNTLLRQYTGKGILTTPVSLIFTDVNLNKIAKPTYKNKDKMPIKLIAKYLSKDDKYEVPIQIQRGKDSFINAMSLVHCLDDVVLFETIEQLDAIKDEIKSKGIFRSEKFN